MNKYPILVDTNIIIHLLNGTNEIVELLDSRPTNISFVSEVELLGWSKLTLKERRSILEFIDNCYYLDYSYQIKDLAITFIQEYNLKLPDAFIAATAAYYNLSLITSDIVFKRVNRRVSIISFDPVTGLIS